MQFDQRIQSTAIKKTILLDCSTVFQSPILQGNMYYHFPNELILMKDFQILQLAEIMTKRMDEHMTMSDAERYKSYPLTEMAYERKMFKALLTNSSQQIIKKWCLVRYSTISGARFAAVFFLIKINTKQFSSPLCYIQHNLI